MPLFTEVPNVPVFLTHMVAPHWGFRTAASSSGPAGERCQLSVFSGKMATMGGAKKVRVVRTIAVGVSPAEIWSLTFMPTPVDVGMIGASVA